MGEYDLVVGTYLLGIFVNTFLFGLVCYQFLVYKNTKFNDPTWIKFVPTSCRTSAQFDLRFRAMVGILFSVDLLHSSVEIYGAWDMCPATHPQLTRGRQRNQLYQPWKPGLCVPTAFLQTRFEMSVIYWVVPFTAATTAVTALIAQIFLGHRVLLLTKSVILTTIIGIFSVSGCIFGITAGIKSGIIREVAKFGPLAPFCGNNEYTLNISTRLSIGASRLSLQTAADLLITVSLTVVLCRSRSSVHRSDIVNRLIRAAIQTGQLVSSKLSNYLLMHRKGFFVSIFALGDLFSFLFLRETNCYMRQTMLDTLIARRAIKQTVGSTFDMDSESNGVAFRMNPRDSITLNTMITTKDIPSRDTEQGLMDTKFSARSNNEMYQS
ncbi:hypothetical protein VNI00_013026 [Paramarasmius palmivorus]|uniref:DUF6534 domain-containing protein n=1 Tax=Paramarasmius palmivorus TaxID=297713 RepID=A0AAW0BYP0_9AGAR